MEPIITISAGIAMIVLLLWAILAFVPYRKYTHEHLESRREQAGILFILSIFFYVWALGGDNA